MHGLHLVGRETSELSAFGRGAGASPSSEGVEPVLACGVSNSVSEHEPALPTHRELITLGERAPVGQRGLGVEHPASVELGLVCSALGVECFAEVACGAHSVTSDSSAIEIIPSARWYRRFMPLISSGKVTRLSRMSNFLMRRARRPALHTLVMYS